MVSEPQIRLIVQTFRARLPTEIFPGRKEVPLDKLLKAVAAGMVNDDVVSTLVARLSRLEREIDEQQDQEIAAQADGKSLATLCHELLDSIDPDKNIQLAGERFGLLDPATEAPGALVAEAGVEYVVAGVGVEPTDEQLAEVERDRMQQALQPFHNPKLRDAILQAKQSLEQVIDTENPDQIAERRFRCHPRRTEREVGGMSEAQITTSFAPTGRDSIAQAAGLGMRLP